MAAAAGQDVQWDASELVTGEIIAMLEAARQSPTGPQTSPSRCDATSIEPIAAKPRAIARAGIGEGARATLGGDVAAPFAIGSFVAPTVFADVTPDMRIAQEEVFGPVVTILRARDVDDAVAIANSTSFGLGGIVFG